MEQQKIKSVFFGGFDKEDVARYIQAAAQEADGLQEEIEALRARLRELDEEVKTLGEENRRLTDSEKKQAEELERLRPLEQESQQLRREVEALRPDAEAHAQLRREVGDIECDARRRAVELKERTAGQLAQAAEHFRSQYETLTESFDSASAHMTAELRKLEVLLTQLPRAMDQTGAELQQLMAELERGHPGAEK